MSLSRVLVDLNGLKRQYSSDSFDRFGDDLSELIISFLPLEDKFDFECLSKQWRRLIFNKVSNLDKISISYYLVKDEDFEEKFKTLKTIFEKCPNVKTIKLYVDRETVSSLPLLADICHSLKSIELEVTKEVSKEEMTAFGQKLGSKVKAIYIRLMSHNKEMLKWLPNLRRLECGHFDWLCLLDNQLVPELNTLREIKVESDEMSSFTKLVDKYENSLKSFELLFDRPEDIDQIFRQLYRLKNMERLSLKGDFVYDINEDMDLTPRMIALSQYCPNLSNIKLNISHISLSRPSKPMMSLKKLNIFCYEMSDDFFFNLSLLTPNLEDISFTLYPKYSDITFNNTHLNDLSQLKHLKRLELKSIAVEDDDEEDSEEEIPQPIDDSSVIHLLDNCKHLKELKLDFETNITSETISALKELANNRPKDSIRFSTKTSGNRTEDLTEIPDNLFINLKPIIDILDSDDDSDH